MRDSFYWIAGLFRHALDLWDLDFILPIVVIDYAL
jgi:hypothetical protein